MDAEIRRYWGVSRLTLGRWSVVGCIVGAGVAFLLASLGDGLWSLALLLLGMAGLCLAYARYRQYLAFRPLHRYAEHQDDSLTIHLPKEGRWTLVPLSVCLAGFLLLAPVEGIEEDVWWLRAEMLYAFAGCVLFSLPFQVRALCRRTYLVLHVDGIVYEGLTHLAGAAWEDVDMRSAFYEWNWAHQTVVFHLPVQPGAPSHVSRRRSWILHLDPRPGPWEIQIPMSVLPEPRRVMDLVTEVGEAATKERREELLASAGRLAAPPVR